MCTARRHSRGQFTVSDIEAPVCQTDERRMASSAMLRLLALVRTDVSEEPNSSLIRVTRIGELVRTLAVTIVRRLLVTASVVPSSHILVTVMKEALSSSESRYLQEPRGVTSQKTTFFSDPRENLKSYVALTGRAL
jgi:hypothetical protein